MELEKAKREPGATEIAVWSLDAEWWRKWQYREWECGMEGGRLFIRRCSRTPERDDHFWAGLEGSSNLNAGREVYRREGRNK
jgi:hypothetical protein